MTKFNQLYKQDWDSISDIEIAIKLGKHYELLLNIITSKFSMVPSDPTNEIEAWKIYLSQVFLDSLAKTLEDSVKDGNPNYCDLYFDHNSLGKILVRIQRIEGKQPSQLVDELKEENEKLRFEIDNLKYRNEYLDNEISFSQEYIRQSLTIEDALRQRIDTLEGDLCDSDREIHHLNKELLLMENDLKALEREAMINDVRSWRD